MVDEELVQVDVSWLRPSTLVLRLLWLGLLLLGGWVLLASAATHIIHVGSEHVLRVGLGVHAVLGLLLRVRPSLHHNHVTVGTLAYGSLVHARPRRCEILLLLVRMLLGHALPAERWHVAPGKQIHEVSVRVGHACVLLRGIDLQVRRPDAHLLDGEVQVPTLDLRVVTRNELLDDLD